MRMTIGAYTSYWCALLSATTHPHIPTSSVQLESRVLRNRPAQFRAPESSYGPTYRYQSLIERVIE
jgi:hypothetical protein